MRDRIRMYGWVGGDDPSGIADAVQDQLDVGLTAVKMNASEAMGRLGTVAEIDGVLDRVAAAREVLGSDRDVAVDFHGCLPRNARPDGHISLSYGHVRFPFLALKHLNASEFTACSS